MAEDINKTPDEQNNDVPPVVSSEAANSSAADNNVNRAGGPPENKHDAHDTGDSGYADDGMSDRLERLGGEPAPAISPEEFARLQQSGQIHIDSRGQVRTTRREDTDAGMSLRKRRAWYR